MLDAVLTRKNVSFKLKITVKTLVSAGVVALAVALPQIVHAVLGAPGGVQWLPMYLPVLLGGCLLGTVWGLGVGIMSPITSFLITLAFGNPMPAAARLPYMIVELAVYGAVSGLFAKSIAKNCFMAFPAALLASVAGRTVFLTVVAMFQSVSALSVATVWAQIQTGLLALVLQAVIVPVIVMAISFFANRQDND